MERVVINYYTNEISKLEVAKVHMIAKRNSSIFLEDINKFNESIYELITIYNENCRNYNKLTTYLNSNGYKISTDALEKLSNIKMKQLQLFKDIQPIIDTIGKPVGKFLPTIAL